MGVWELAFWVKFKGVPFNFKMGWVEYGGNKVGTPETITLGSNSHLSSHRRKSRTFRNLDGKTMSGGGGKLSRGSNRGPLDVFQVWSSIVNVRGHAGTKCA